MEVIKDKESYTYTPYFCEENIWKLCDNIKSTLNSYYVIFLTNKFKQMPIWTMRTVQDKNQFTIWDYHVILMVQYYSDEKFQLKNQNSSVVYDFDSNLPFGICFTQYSKYALREDIDLRDQYRRMFRVVPAAIYLRYFASDRSHMMNERGDFLQPPPPFPCIQSQFGEKNSLPQYLDIEKNTGSFTDLLEFQRSSEASSLTQPALIPYGVVLDQEQFNQFANLSQTTFTTTDLHL